jgi:hypothetical protein
VPALPTVPLVRTSERKDFKRCQWRWWQKWRRGLVNQDVGNALWFGTGIHLALENYYQTGTKRTPKRALEAWDAYCAEDYGRLMRDEDDQRVSADELGRAMLHGYFQRWGGDPQFFFIAVERSGELPVVDDNGQIVAMYGYTYDGLLRELKTGRYWVFETNTAKSITLGHLSLDDQAGSYLWTAPEDLRRDDLIPDDFQIAGILYNFMRKAMPDERPRDAQGFYLNKNGTRSLSQPTALYHREPVTRTRAEGESQRRRIVAEVQQMNEIRAGRLMLTKTPTRDCSWDCPFFNLCELHEAGQDWQGYARDAYTVEDPYANHRKAADGG